MIFPERLRTFIACGRKLLLGRDRVLEPELDVSAVIAGPAGLIRFLGCSHGRGGPRGNVRVTAPSLRCGIRCAVSPTEAMLRRSRPRGAADNVADFIEAHGRTTQRGHVGADRRRFLPAPPL